MIQIKEEFKKLIPVLTEEEFKQLEDNCLRDGILTPIYLYIVLFMISYVNKKMRSYIFFF